MPPRRNPGNRLPRGGMSGNDRRVTRSQTGAAQQQQIPGQQVPQDPVQPPHVQTSVNHPSANQPQVQPAPEAGSPPNRRTATTRARHIEGFPPFNTPLPANVTADDVMERYHNHLVGETLLMVRERYTIAQIVRRLNQPHIQRTAMSQRSSHAMRNFRRDHPNVVPPTLMRREAPLGNVDSAFPSARDPLPEGLTDEQIIQSYPNHLRGEIASRIAAELFEDDWAAFAAAVTAATGNTMGEGTLRLRAQRYRESLPEPQPVLQGRPNNRAERRAQNEATGYHDENDQAMAEGPAYNTRAQQRMTQARTSTGPGSADLQIANFPGSDEVMPEGLDPREIVDRFPNHLHGLTLVRVLDEISVDEIAARVGHGLTPENLTDRRYAAGNWEELEESSEESTDSENQNGEEADADPVQPPQQQPVQPAPVQNDQLVGARPNENGQLFADDATEVERVLESGNVDPGLLDLTRSPQEAYMGRGSGLEDIEMEFGLNQLGAFGDLEGMNMEANHFEGGEPEGSVEQADGDEGLIQDAFDEFINPDMVEDDEDVDMEDSENDDEDVEMEG